MGDNLPEEKVDGCDEIVEQIKACSSMRERYAKLHKLVPEVWELSPMSARMFIYYLAKDYGLDFGVCRFYSIKDGRQFCLFNGKDKPVECTCAIPQFHCVIRDGEGEASNIKEPD